MEVERDFELKWRLGARPIVLFAELAGRFASSVRVSRGAQVADGKSIVSLMMLGDPAGGGDRCEEQDLQAGTRIRVSTSGPDAEQAMGALSKLLTCGERVDRCATPGCPSRPVLTSFEPTNVGYGCARGHAWTVDSRDAPVR